MNFWNVEELLPNITGDRNGLKIMSAKMHWVCFRFYDYQKALHQNLHVFLKCVVDIKWDSMWFIAKMS